MNQRTLLKSAAVFLIAYLALLALSLQFGHRYVELLLPIYHWEIGWLTPDYRILSLGLQDNRGEEVIALNLQLMHYIVVEEHVLSPGGNISSSTLAGHALQDAVLMLSLLAAWPTRRFYKRLLLLAGAVPVLLLVEMLDIPLMLLGSMDDLILSRVAPDASSFLVYWMHFLDGGGRLALSIVGALLVVVFGRLWFSSPAMPRQNVL
ncbi:hypothetical protein [Sulfurirhabdus autotrophica]|nr:hypothetical protein [Sulfurirhabdus autotrophica]